MDDKEEGIPDELIQGLADLGIFGIMIRRSMAVRLPKGKR